MANQLSGEKSINDFCVIFDLDGTLVDSESLCNQAFINLLPAVKEPVEKLVRRYRGLKLSEIFDDIEQRFGVTLPLDFESTYRAEVSALFETQLHPTPGTVEMLAAFDQPLCVASSGPLSKINHSLSVTNLAGYFGKNVFSSYEIGAWKPDPGLFLHAAAQMGYPPEKCVVIEDSAVGITAGIAAGMHVLHYYPDGTTTSQNNFKHMSELSELIRTLEMETI